MNFVAYAADGVSWFAFTKVKNKLTPSSCISNLTQTAVGRDLRPDPGKREGLELLHGRSPASKAAAAEKPVKSSSPPPSTSTRHSQARARCRPSTGYIGEKSETYVASLGTKYAATHIIVENEDHSILKNGDDANAIFFFSFGKFNLECTGKNAAGCVPKGDAVHLGAVTGSVPTEEGHPLLYDHHVHRAAGPVPVPRLLYNIYSNGSNKSFPAASAFRR